MNQKLNFREIAETGVKTVSLAYAHKLVRDAERGGKRYVVLHDELKYFLPPAQEFFNGLPIFHPYTLNREQSKRLDTLVGSAIRELEKEGE